MTTNYAEHFSTKQTPQSEPIPGSAQVPNSAGGFSFKLDDWNRLDRWLVLGSSEGSYYASEQKLTKENAEAVLRCIKADGLRVVRTIVDISTSGRAPKNDPALFALAMAMKLGDEKTKKMAGEVLPQVARIGTDLFHLASFCDKAFGGWGRGTRGAFAKWYTGKPLGKLAYQTVKYQSRDGWSHRDVLRLAHAAPETEAHALLHAWAGRWNKPNEVVAAGLGKLVDGSAVPDGLALVAAFEEAKRATSTKEVVRLIEQHKLTHEMVPTEFLKEAQVWAALLPHMKPWALVRNLARMTANGLLKPMAKEVALITTMLGDESVLRAERLHPIKVLTALLQYKAGHGNRGSLTWEPVGAIVDALDAAFYKTFGCVEPANKRTLLALDVSGSMSGWNIAGVEGLTPRVGSCAMALVTAATEKQHAFVAFTSGARGEWKHGKGNSQHYGYAAGITELAISPKARLDHVCEATAKLPMGGTDCALPMLWAMDRKVEVDTFCVYTDSETWHGDIHPAQALQQYRQKMGIPARLVVVGMVANEFSIADPNDAGMLDVVGFDTTTPELISGFSAGRF